MEKKGKTKLNDWYLWIYPSMKMENIFFLHWIAKNSFLSQMTIILNCIWQ